LCSGYSVLQELTKALELKLEEKETCGTTETWFRSWMASGRQEGAGKKLKGKIVGTLKRLETFHTLTHTEQKDTKQKKMEMDTRRLVLPLHKLAGDIVLKQLNPIYMLVLDQ
jgi:hypothetical protein